MGKAKTPSFILELGLETSSHNEAELNARFEAARQLYNACLSEAKQRLELLRQSKAFQETRSMPKTVNGKPNKERTEAFKALNAKFGFTEYDIHAYTIEIRNSWLGDHIDSATAQKLASRAFKAVQRIAFGQAKRVRFKGKNQLKSVEGKSNKAGIRYKEKTGQVEWLGLKLQCIIDVNDKVVVHGLSCPVKYCRIIKRIFNGKARFFVQLILEGKPFIKEKNKAASNTVGLDIGPSTIACVTDDNATLELFCDELKDKQKEIRRLQRSLERKRRANNPQNYNPDGTIKKGKKTWHYSNRYKKVQHKLADLQRKLAAHRKTLHGNLANRILRQGKHVKTEKLSYKAFQKNFGKSVKNRAPGMFLEILRRKAENAGGSVVEFSTKTTKLSQYCHKCGQYTKKPLSQRWHTCCGLNIQRDLYSAFLAGSVVENTLDTADVIKRWRSTETVLLRAVSHNTQVANGRHLPSSFGLRVRDRATRLRSSDVLEKGIPDAKNRDVVAIQLELF
ncbi:transposase [bacterium]|nr:transposase [bacterium]